MSDDHGPRGGWIGFGLLFILMLIAEAIRFLSSSSWRP